MVCSAKRRFTYGNLFLPGNPGEEDVARFILGLMELSPEIAEECMRCLPDEDAEHIWCFLGKQYNKEEFGWAVIDIIAAMDHDPLEAYRL